MKVFNHGIHIILDILTCGLWLPVHLLLWALAPTVPIGMGGSHSSANTTIVFGPGHYPQQHPHPHHAQPGYPAAQPYVPPPAPSVSRPAAPPAWAIEEARERLPQDAPWDVVASVAWEFVERQRTEGNQFPAPPRQLPE